MNNIVCACANNHTDWRHFSQTGFEFQMQIVIAILIAEQYIRHLRW